jgi:hypothetical protein
VPVSARGPVHAVALQVESAHIRVVTTIVGVGAGAGRAVGPSHGGLLGAGGRRGLRVVAAGKRRVHLIHVVGVHTVGVGAGVHTGASAFAAVLVAGAAGTVAALREPELRGMSRQLATLRRNGTGGQYRRGRGLLGLDGYSGLASLDTVQIRYPRTKLK